MKECLAKLKELTPKQRLLLILLIISLIVADVMFCLELHVFLLIGLAAVGVTGFLLYRSFQ